MKDVLWIPINALQAVWMVGFSSFCFVPGMLTVLFTGNNEAAFSMGRAFWGPLNLMMGFSSLTIEGQEHLPKGGTPCVAMFNHQSMIDIVVAWMVLPTGPRFVAKKVLMYVPLVGLFMWIMGMVPIDRSNRHAAIAALRRAQGVIKEGRILTVFPEGTRTKDGRILPFKKGVFVVAHKANAPILPIALEGCATLVPRTGWKPRPSKLRVKIGAPIDTRGLSREELMTRVRNAIIDLNVDIGGPGGDRTTVIAANDEEPAAKAGESEGEAVAA